MRAVLMIVLLGGAFWRAGADWQATIGNGYAYRLGTIGNVLSAHWPDKYARLIDNLGHSGVPYAWNPIGAFVMSLPLALVLAVIAGGIWVTRDRSRTR